MNTELFDFVSLFTKKPIPFSKQTARELWTGEHTSQQMLDYHLNPEINAASRNPKFIDKSVRWMADRFTLNSTKTVADFGCGPGLYCQRLAQTGAKVTGIDFSKNSLSYAETQSKALGLDINYECCDYRNYDGAPESFDLILMIMCDFCVLSRQEREEMLKKFKLLLRPEGRIVFDVFSPSMFEHKEESLKIEKNQLNGFWSENDYIAVVQTLKYETEMVSLDRYAIVQPEGTNVYHNWLQYFSLESLRSEIESTGLSIEEHLANVAGDEYQKKDYELAVVLNKK